MVDRHTRDCLAVELRHFAAGVISSDEYWERTIRLAPFATDEALMSISMSIDDLEDTNTLGKRRKKILSRATRHEIARCILFLYSDLEYEFPPSQTGSCSEASLSLITRNYSGSFKGG